MQKQNFQTAELRDENNNIVQTGAYGRKTPLTTGDNQGWIDFVMNNLEWLKANGITVNQIATRTQAEEGTDNTTVMTPKGVDYRLNKNRSLKTYTTYEQLDFSGAPTSLTELLEGIPAYSQFVRYVGTNQYKSLGLPTEGILEIIKGQYLDYASLKLQRYGGDSSVRSAYFENWRKGQTSFKWSEVGKNYTTFAQLGFESAPTLTKLLETIPANSKFTSYVYQDTASVMGLPNGCILEITKGSDPTYAKIICNRGVSTECRMWYENWQKGQTTFDWKEVAANGALSMPSNNAISCSLESVDATYTAPCDGWFRFQSYLSGGVEYSVTLAINDTRIFSETSKYYHIAYLPMAKGDVVKLSQIGDTNAQIVCNFYYAQSEV